MKAARALLLLGLLPLPQGAPVPADAAPADAPAVPAAERLREVPGRMRALAERLGAGDAALALSLADQLLAEAEELALPERTRAELHFARGLALAALAEEGAAVQGGEDLPGTDRLAATDAFQSARALAGPGALRLDATYDAGTVHLLEAERLRATIPEIAGAAGAPPPLPPPSGSSGAPAAQPPDPLPLARAAYLAARAVRVERLRADWRDPDTRANLELVQRRLRELDALEEERRQQQQEQQQQDPGQQGEDAEQPPEGEDGEEQPQEGEPSEGEPKDGDEPREPQEGADPEEREPQPQEPSESEPGPETAEAPADPQPAKGEVDAERHLTREEVLRLLDRLQDLEQEAQSLRAALREARRIPVERDW